MIFKLQIDKDCEEEITATVHRRTPLIDEIEKLVLQENITDKIPGYHEYEITMLDISQVECFYVEADKTYASYISGKRYLIKKRLYELENVLPADFERINKSAIANWKRISKFKVQLSGAVDVIFKNGYTDYISRRCFAELKRRYGL